MGADVARALGGETEGDGGHAGDGQGVEAFGAWAGVEEVAEMIALVWTLAGLVGHSVSVLWSWAFTELDESSFV